MKCYTGFNNTTQRNLKQHSWCLLCLTHYFQLRGQLRAVSWCY